MTVKVRMANGSSDSVDFLNDAGTTLAQVKSYDSGSSNGQVGIFTTASGVSSEKVRVDSAGRVGIGTGSNALSNNMEVVGSSRINEAYAQNGYEVTPGSPTTTTAYNRTTSTWLALRQRALQHEFYVQGSEAARIDSSGNLLVGCTSFPSASVAGYKTSANILTGATTSSTGSSTSAIAHYQFINGNGTVGQIYTSGSTTTFATSSDYRLKENIAPMAGALETLAQLRPVTYTWKADGSEGQGFIAHELQAVVPDCVTGEKDAVDENGNPVYQGIDTSFLVATLTAAIQEQQALIVNQQSQIDALTERLTALENK